MVIYKIRNNLNNKIYIGQTIQDIQRRWHQHCHESKYRDSKLYRAINKYGKDNFSISIICRASNMQELNARETSCIKLFNSINKGYNCTSGGFNCKHSQETKSKISTKIKQLNIKPWLGKNLPMSTRLKISKTKKLKKQAVGSDNPMFSKQHKVESIVKNAISNGSKPFIVYRKSDIIGKWVNKTKCARELGLSREQVRDCLKGRYKSSMGYKFRYCNEER